MPATNNSLTPLQQELVDLYTKKLKKENELKALVAQKKADIAASKKKTIEKLNTAAEGISLSQAQTMKAFSDSLAHINAAFVELEKEIGHIEEEGGEQNAIIQ